MESSTTGTVSTEQKLRNIMVALTMLTHALRNEDRHDSADHADAARREVLGALADYSKQLSAHD